MKNPDSFGLTPELNFQLRKLLEIYVVSRIIGHNDLSIQVESLFDNIATSNNARYQRISASPYFAKYQFSARIIINADPSGVPKLLQELFEDLKKGTDWNFQQGFDN